MATSNLALQAFKAAREESNQSPISEDTSSFPLWAFLVLLEKGDSHSYSNYLEGATALYYWLTHNQRPLQIPATSLVTKVPRLAFSYEAEQVAKILAGSRERFNSLESYLQTLAIMRKGIYHCMMCTVIRV